MAQAAEAMGTMSTGEQMMQKSNEVAEAEAIQPILPHGGRLVSRVLTGEARADAIDRARDLPMI